MILFFFFHAKQGRIGTRCKIIITKTLVLVSYNNIIFFIFWYIFYLYIKTKNCYKCSKLINVQVIKNRLILILIIPLMESYKTIYMLIMLTVFVGDKSINVIFSRSFCKMGQWILFFLFVSVSKRISLAIVSYSIHTPGNNQYSLLTDLNLLTIICYTAQ